MSSMLKGCTPWPQGFVDHYWAAGYWRGNTLDNLLRDWALRYGPRAALVHGGTRLTYAALNRRADRMAAAFRLRGLRPGQRVVVQLPGAPEFVVTVFALMRAGLVPVLCPLSLREPEIPDIVRLTQAVGYVGPSVHNGFDHSAMAARIAAQWPFLRRVFTVEPPGTSSPYGGLTTDPSGCQYSPLDTLDSPPGPALAPSADRVAFFTLSAAVGDTPRLVPRTHNDYACQLRAAAELVPLAETDVYLAALPAESELALGCPGILGVLAGGGTVVLAEGQEPAAHLSLIERERVTLTSLSPEAARAWLDELPADQADLSSLRLLQVVGGTPLPRAAAERLGAALGCRSQSVLALPEGLLVLPGGEDRHGTTALTAHSHPLPPGDETRVIGSDGTEVPDGQPGELLVRGPHTVRGYYRAPEQNAVSFTPEGYFRTGVRAARTCGGRLLVTGRITDVPD
ncbi:AMP-binding protein [Streptomyces sp. NPDC048111]|uniref:AMP-binding protein n=1 Tax=Streptomyces sp. NPDC048111 TaxID=3365500 RepID=UPI003722371A